MSGTNKRRVLASSRTRLQRSPVTGRSQRPCRFRKPTQPRRVCTQWVRGIRSSSPVRGPTRPSIHPSLTRLEEVYPKVESQRPLNFSFFFSISITSPSSSRCEILLFQSRTDNLVVGLLLDGVSLVNFVSHRKESDTEETLGILLVPNSGTLSLNVIYTKRDKE